MARWLVNSGDRQFGVESLDELKRLAARREIRGGDMVQPPGAADWLYASEIPELKTFLSEASRRDDDDDVPRSGGLAGLFPVLVAVCALIIIGGFGAAWYYSGRLDAEKTRVVGDEGLAYSEMLVTREGAPLLADPDGKSRSLSSLQKDSVLTLLAKRGDFYRAKTKTGQEGWIPVADVIPMYLLGGGKVRDEYDPLYNPDRYLDVSNASWMGIDEENKNLTIFRFQMRNKSKYPMTDIVVQATVKDARGTELERVEIPLRGVIPAMKSSMVGTLEPDPKNKDEKPLLLIEESFVQMAASDGDLYLRYKDGIEVEMKSADFAKAEIDVVEVRSAPDLSEK